MSDDTRSGSEAPRPEPSATGEPAGTGPQLNTADESTPKLGRSAVQGFAWQVLSFGGNRVVLFASTLILARLLDPRDFGVFAAALTFTTYLEILLDFGVGSYLVYKQEGDDSDVIHTAFFLNIATTFVLTGVAVATSPLTARLLGAPHQASVFAVTSLYLVLRGLSQINQSMIQRDLHFKKFVVSGLSQAFGRAIATVGLAFAGFGVWAIVGGFLIGQAINTGACWALAPYRPRFRFRMHLARRMLRFGLGGTAVDLVDALSLNADYLVIGAAVGDVALGFYSVAFRLADLLINNLLWIFSAVAFPVYSRSRTGGIEVLRALMLRALRLTTTYGFVAGIGLALLSRDAILSLFGPKWAPAIGTMAVLSLASSAACLSYACDPLFPAIGRPGGLLKLSIPQTVVDLVGFAIAVPYGIFWVAVVHLITNTVAGVVRVAYGNHLVGAHYRQALRALGPTATISIGMVACGLPVRLLTTPGWAALFEILAAAAGGGVIGASVWGREMFDEVRGLARHLLTAD